MTLTARKKMTVAGSLIALLLLAGCREVPTFEEQLEIFRGMPEWKIALGIGLATIISEDLACITAGMIAGEGVVSLRWAIIGAFCGIFFPDLILYFLGRMGGIALLRRRPFRWFIKENQVVQAEKVFEGHGTTMIFLSRLLPGSRIPVYVAAGILNYPWWRFFLFMLIACGVWTPFLVWISMKVGSPLIDLLKVYEVYALPVFLGVIFAIWLVLKLLEILATRRSRLEFLARVRGLYRAIRKPPKKAGKTG